MNQVATDKFISEGNVRLNGTDKKSADYKALKSNINKVGILTPISYRKNDKGDFIVINGHQRLAIAKDLKIKEVPAFETNGEIDDLTKQLSTNMFIVGMSHLDASYAIDQMVEKGVVNTRKQLSSMFGKSIAWVDTALAFCNLHDWIKQYISTVESVEWSELSSPLTEISKSPINIQYNIIKDLINDYWGDEDEENHNFDNFKELIDDWDCYGGENHIVEFFKEMAPKLESDKTKWKIICDIIGEDTFREYEKSHDIKYVYQNALFKEYEDLQFCQDENFLVEIFCSETEIGAFLLDNDTKIDYSYSEYEIDFSFKHKMSSLKANVKKKTGFALTDIIIDSWNGNVFNPTLDISIPDEDEKSEKAIVKSDEDYSSDDTKDPNQLKYNKFNKWAFPYLDEHIITCIDPTKYNKDGQNIVVKWLLLDLECSLEISKPWHFDDDDKGYHPINELKSEEGKILNDNNLILEMSKLWFNQFYRNADFEQLDTLLEFQKQTPCKEVLAEVFHKDEEARKVYFKVFSKNDLIKLTANGTKKTKAEYVDLAASIKWDEIPLFDLVLTNLGSGPTSLGTYKS